MKRSAPTRPRRLRLPLLGALALIGVQLGQGVALAGPAQVRLLFPILQGDELEQLLRVAPNATLVDLRGATFVLLGSYSDARVAYRLGRTLQRRLVIPFDLAYDPGHPQGDGSWLAEVDPGRRSADLATQPARPPGQPPLAAVAPSQPRPASAPGRPAALAAAITQPQREPQPPLAAVAPSQPRPASADGARRIASAAVVPAPVAVASAQPASAQPQAAPAQREREPQPPLAAQPPAEPRTARAELPGWEGSAVPVSRLAAVRDPAIDYLFVKVSGPEDLERLRQVVPVADVSVERGMALARVGVFTRSSRGRQLLDQRLQQLRGLELNLLLARNGDLSPIA